MSHIWLVNFSLSPRHVIPFPIIPERERYGLRFRVTLGPARGRAVAVGPRTRAHLLLAVGRLLSFDPSPPLPLTLLLPLVLHPFSEAILCL
jgi:hypothetical protein